MSFFTIDPTLDHVRVAAGGAESIAFSVTNKSGVGRQVRAIIETDGGDAQRSWFTVTPEVQDARVDETVQFVVALNVPADAAAGSYPFRLKVVAEDDPDDVHSTSQSVPVEVGAGGGGGFPYWTLIVAAVVLAVLVVVLILVFGGGDTEETTTTAVATTTTSSTTTSTTTTVVPSTVDITFDAFPDGTPINSDVILNGDEFAAFDVRLTGAPEGAYCSQATAAAIRPGGTYASNDTANFLTSSDPAAINSCNGSLVQIEFRDPVRAVSLLFVGASTTYTLQAFDAGGALVATTDVESVLRGGRFDASVFRPAGDIKRVTFGEPTAVTSIVQITYDR